MSLKAPYCATVTLRHDSNPAGTPENKPVTFALEDVALTEIDDTSIYPWLILHHEDNPIKEVDDGNNGPAQPFEENAPEENPTVSLENGYVSPAVGESKKVKINFRYTGDGMVLNQGEKFSIGLRGSWVRCWKWGMAGGQSRFSWPLRYVLDGRTDLHAIGAARRRRPKAANI